jgi:phosphate uptake regulator
MRVKIGIRFYELNTSFMSAFRFRARYNKSLLDASFDNNDMLKLIHTAITDLGRPSLHEIKEAARADTRIYRAARALFSEILKMDARSVTQAEKPSTEALQQKVDEYHAVSLFASTGLPERLLDELSLMQVYAITMAFYEATNRRNSDHIASQDEVRNLYSISDTQEDAIQAFLREHPELAVEI